MDSSLPGVTKGSSLTVPLYLYKNGSNSSATMAAMKNGASRLVLSKRVFLGLPSLPILEEIRLAKDLEAAGLLFFILSLKVKLSFFFSSGINASYQNKTAWMCPFSGPGERDSHRRRNQSRLLLCYNKEIRCSEMVAHSVTTFFTRTSLLLLYN